jgi:predicted nucleotidyltransferase
MAERVVARLRRWREGRVGERSDRDDDQILVRRLRVEDLRAAVRAEVEDVFLPVRLVRDAGEVAVTAADLHLVGLEAGLHPEGAAGAALAGEAVTEVHAERLARRRDAELAALTSGLTSGGHRGAG